jgi:hypothetical protein
LVRVFGEKGILVRVWRRERVIGESLLEKEGYWWEFVGERGLLVSVCWREKFIGVSLLESVGYW